MMPGTRHISVLVADDSAFMRTALRRMIESDDALSVVDTACDGVDALAKIHKLRPDVVTLDIEMPRLNGLNTLRHIMQQCPCPVIMVSSLTQEGAQVTLDALDFGAFDYISKDLSYASLDIIKIRKDLIAKIKAAASSAVFSADPPAISQLPSAAFSQKLVHARARARAPEIVCIGTSTGGPKALQQLLPTLPASFPSGILIVQHMPPGFTGPFAQRLNTLCKIYVREACDHDPIEPGVALIAPASWHMLPYRVGNKAFVQLTKEPGDTLHRPAVDVTMLAATTAFGPATLGVIMTGMGDDGARGMKAIHDCGGYTIGQDQASCAVYGMPRSCAELGILDSVVPLDALAHAIMNHCRSSRPALVTAPLH